MPVTGLIVDQQAALLAEGCLEPGTAKCTYGTGAFLLAQLGGDAARSTSGLATSVAWRLRDHTSLLRRRAGLHGRLRGALARRPRAHRRPPTIDPSRPMTATACCACPRSPGWPRRGGTPRATASFTGMTLSAPAAATWCGPCWRASPRRSPSWPSSSATTSAQPLTRLRVDGGLTRSAVLMQAQADLAQLPVEVYPSPHATALGAAACARLALDPALDRRRRRRRVDAGGDLRAAVVRRTGPPSYLARWHAAAAATAVCTERRR